MNAPPPTASTARRPPREPSTRRLRPARAASSSRPAPAPARPGCWCRASCARLLDGAAAAGDPRHHLHPQGRRRDAAAAVRMAARVRRAGDCTRRSASTRCASAASTASRPSAPTRALAALHERVLDAGRGRSRSAPSTAGSRSCCVLRRCELLDEIGLAPQANCWRTRTSTAARSCGASTPRCCAIALRADHATLVRQRGPQPGRHGWTPRWSSVIELELADRAGTLDGSVSAPAVPEVRWRTAGRVSGAAWRDGLQQLAVALAPRPKKTARDAARALHKRAIDDSAVSLRGVWRLLFTTTARRASSETSSAGHPTRPRPCRA